MSSLAFSQGVVAEGLVKELLQVLAKYDDSVLLPTALGCLDLVKMQILQAAIANESHV